MDDDFVARDARLRSLCMPEVVFVFDFLYAGRVPYFLILLGFVIVHVISRHWEFREASMRKAIAFSGGVGIAYVVLNLFPYLPYSQNSLNQAFGWGEDSVFKYTIYAVVLLGLAIAYTLQKIDMREVKKLQKRNPRLARSILFGSNIAFFAIYNAMIGYIVGSGALSHKTNRLVYFLAFGLHFFMNDCVLRHHFRKRYDRSGWFVLAGSVFLGGMLALVLQVPDVLVVLFKAMITGAMILVVIRYELPQDSKSSLRWFWLGTFCAASLFIAL